jgi:hypothetical protein
VLPLGLKIFARLIAFSEPPSFPLGLKIFARLIAFSESPSDSTWLENICSSDRIFRVAK